MNKHTNVQDDICTQQQSIIEDLRAKVKELEQKIDYYREVQADYNKLKAQIGKNPQLYYQIVQPYDQGEDYREQKRREARSSAQ